MPGDESLAEQVILLTDEVKVLRESVDGLKAAFEKAIRKSRITVQFDEAANAQADRVAEPGIRPAIELFEIGDGVSFDRDGIDYFGEIIELNDGENLAMVQLIPSGDTVDVIQDYLTHLENDPLSYRKDEPCQNFGQVEEPKSPSPKRGRQLTLDFEAEATHEAAEPFDGGEHRDQTAILSKDAFTARTRTIWDAVNAWIVDYTPAFGFDAYKLGVFEKIEPEWRGTFSDADQVRLLKDDYALACGVAIAVEDASIMIEEHGHSADAETLIRAYYLAIALATAGFDLEHYLPGFPIHSLEMY